ncbi:heavy metal-binding domain-containing protein [Streptomyces sp. NPDC052164]|uniref:heavy metal-binding domain-containing protein n=2 Tax=Streptomyces TaxID=1883 RepID=UPI0034461EF0
MAMARRVSFPVPVLTVDNPQRTDRSVTNSWVVWGDQQVFPGEAFSSLSVNAAGVGADEVIGARLTAVQNGVDAGSWYVVAYGTAISYG